MVRIYLWKRAGFYRTYNRYELQGTNSVVFQNRLRKWCACVAASLLHRSLPSKKSAAFDFARTAGSIDGCDYR